MSRLVNEVKESFSGLTDSGRLAMATVQEYPETFGNAVAVLECAEFRVRIVNDRGDVLADAAPASEPENWAPLERMLRAVGVRDVRPEGPLSGALTQFRPSVVWSNSAERSQGLPPALATG